MQYFMHEDRILSDLPLKSVDAGAGLERFCVILQGVDSVYETDLLFPITETFASTSHSDHSKSVRIMTDHIRSAVFMIADGIHPANTKREYVLRRIIRRAVLHANLSKTDTSKLFVAAERVISNFSHCYPVLNSNRERIITTLKQETTSFEKVLRRGMKEFAKIASRSAGNISGENAFMLYDTLGFPLELTKELATLQGLSVNESRFWTLLEAQREQSGKKP